MIKKLLLFVFFIQDLVMNFPHWPILKGHISMYDLGVAPSIKFQYSIGQDLSTKRIVLIKIGSKENRHLVDENFNNLLILRWNLSPFAPLLLRLDSNILDDSRHLTIDNHFPWIAFDLPKHFLNAFIKISNDKLKLKCILFDVASAIKLINDNGYRHNDVSFENIVITYDDEIVARAKLSNFRSLTTIDSTIRVEKYHNSPELVIQDSYLNYVMRNSDVWSFGILLHKIMEFGYNVPIFLKVDELSTWKSILRENLINESEVEPDKIRKFDAFFHCGAKSRKAYMAGCYNDWNDSDCYCDLLLKCLTFDTRKRITVDEILNHKYLTIVKGISWLGLDQFENAN